MAGENAEKLPDSDHPDTVASSRDNEIEVAFQIVVSGDKISRVALDGCLQNFVVIGIAAYLQIA